MKKLLFSLTVVGLMFVAAPQAQASAILAGFNGNSLAANDDGSTGLVALGFNLNFYSQNFANLYVNNNGNVTFNAALSQFTPTGITGGSQPTMAPFWGDVDTRTAQSAPATNLVTYGTGSVDGHSAFGVNWIGVGYFAFSPSSNRNSFQLVIVDRSDVAAGDFDFMFNYDKIQWEAGTASGSDSFGCGGTPAHVGWTNGAGTYMEFAGSGVSGAFLDSGNCGNVNAAGADVLITHSLNSNVAGQYVFNVREGRVVAPPPIVPEPGTLFLFGTGLAFAASRLRRKS